MAAPSVVPSSCAAVLRQSGQVGTSFIVEIVDIRRRSPCRPAREVAVTPRLVQRADSADEIVIERVDAGLAVVELRAEAGHPPGPQQKRGMGMATRPDGFRFCHPWNPLELGE